MRVTYQDYTPTTITNLRERLRGWEIEYHTNWAFHEGKRKLMHWIYCWVKDDEHGVHWSEKVTAQSWTKEKAIARVFVAVRGTEHMEG